MVCRKDIHSIAKDQTIRIRLIGDKEVRLDVVGEMTIGVSIGF